MMRAVLILRPQPGADETAERARARGLEPVVAPMFRIEPRVWTPPPADAYDAVLITSANAARQGGEGLAAFRHLPCYAVGESSALAAAQAGFEHVRTGPSDGAALVEMMARDGIRRAFHPTATETTELPETGVEIHDVAVYSAEAEDRLSDVAVAAVHAGAIVLLHSPRSAALFAERIGERRAQARIAAISDAAAAAAGPGWAGVAVALEPRDEAVLSAAEQLADSAVAEGAKQAPAPPPKPGVQGRKRPWLQPLLIGLAAFALGIAAMAWVLTRWDGAAQFLGLASEPVPTPVNPAAAPPQRQLLQPAPTATDPAIVQRLAALEQRLGELGVDAQTAVGNVDRAEGLLVAFAARRALERGVGLGYLEGLLRQRFGQTQPVAVGTIIEFSRRPVTMQQLRAGLTEIGPRLVGAAPGQSFFQALANELSNLLVVRRAGTPSTDPRERLERATARLEAGQVEEALQEVLRMPGRENGREWVDAARRYVAARQALDAIELAAFVEPRMPAPAAPPPAAEGEEPGEQPAEQQPRQNPTAR